MAFMIMSALERAAHALDEAVRIVHRYRQLEDRDGDVANVIR
jgi:hypothetical protein